MQPAAKHMDKKRFAALRAYLGKTQLQLARLMGTSAKAIQSFEQGWRNIPPHNERQIYFLVARTTLKGNTPIHSCWEVLDCPADKREKCPAWEYRCGHMCWFINGTICRGEVQHSWQQKMELCRQCRVFREILPPGLKEG